MQNKRLMYIYRLNAATVLFYQRFAHVIIRRRRPSCPSRRGHRRRRFCMAQSPDSSRVRTPNSETPKWQNIIIWIMHMHIYNNIS